jgi:hypothetical protein
MNESQLVVKTPIQNQTIIDTITEKGSIIIYEKDSEVRKQLHKFAKSKGFFHVSYIDKSKDFDKELRYWCESCARFLNKDEYSQIDNNFYSEGEFFIYCTRCYDEEDLCDRVIASEEGYMYDEGYHKPKWVKKNNTIAIANDMKYLKEIFDKKQIKKPIEWIKKREDKFK